MTIATRVMIPNEVDYRVTAKALLTILRRWGFGSTEGPDGAQIIVVLETGGKLAHLTIKQREKILTALPMVQLIDSWTSDFRYRP